MQLQRYFIHLAFKGTHYFGWQIQPNQISVQGCINDALTKINGGSPILVVGCGRTDTGVHARSFYAHVDLDVEITTEQLAHKLNCMLPSDIAIYSIQKVAPDMHARFSALSRTYHYHIHVEKDAFISETSYFLRAKLNLELMNAACELLRNHSYFKCFSKNVQGDSSYLCSVTAANWIENEAGYQFTITANRFLRNMVRAIVGTMIDVGTERISIAEFKKILDSESRSDAGKSVPACGLFLADVVYP